MRFYGMIERVLAGLGVEAVIYLTVDEERKKQRAHPAVQWGFLDRVAPPPLRSPEASKKQWGYDWVSRVRSGETIIDRGQIPETQLREIRRLVATGTVVQTISNRGIAYRRRRGRS
jgi:hypothetical protein